MRHLDHVNYLAEDSGANGDLICDALGARVTEQILLDSGVFSGQWTHFNQKSYDLVYTDDRTGSRRRLHHIAFSTDTPRGHPAPPTSAWTTACSSRPARTSTPSTPPAGW